MKQDRSHGTVPITPSSGVVVFHNQEKSKGPDVITGRYGTIGNAFFAKQSYWPLNTAPCVKYFKGK